MRKGHGNNRRLSISCILFLAVIILSVFSCGKETVDQHKDFVSAASGLFIYCSKAELDYLERYEYPECGEVYYYIEAHYTDYEGEGATAGIIDIALGGSWEFYHKDYFEGIGKNVYHEYLKMKAAGNGGEITGEELETLTQRINDELQKALADTAE